MKKTVKVVGAIIENEDKEILCALRSKDMSQGCLWEFPGGKIEIGESIAQAIVREIKEELGCTVEFIDEVCNHTHEYDKVIVNLITTKCRLISGTPKANEHEKLIWLNKSYLNALKWAPADIPTVNLLLEK